MKIRIDGSLCSGHGRCYALAPGVFDCDDRGYGRVRIEEPPAELCPQARAAARGCPEQAIFLDG